MSIIIKLETKHESLKAFKLLNDSWVPKSKIESKGYQHPYYEVNGFWVQGLIYKMQNEKCKDSLKKLEAIGSMKIDYRDIPADVRKKHSDYWSGHGSGLFEAVNDIGAVNGMTFEDLGYRE